MSIQAPSRFKDLCLQFEGESPDGKLYSDFFYQSIINEIVEFGNEAIAYLKHELITRQNQPSRLRAILFGLGQVPPKTLKERNSLGKILLPYLNSPFPNVVAETIDSFASLHLLQYTDTVLSLNQHESAYVRGSILRFMAKLHPEKAIPLLLASLESEDAIIRENAIDELDGLDFKGAIPYLSKLINDSDTNVRQAAQTALDNLQDAD
jgi:hypothetical protein